MNSDQAEKITYTGCVNKVGRGGRAAPLPPTGPCPPQGGIIAYTGRVIKKTAPTRSIQSTVVVERMGFEPMTSRV